MLRNFEPKDEAAVIELWETCGLLRPWNDPRKDIRRKLEHSPDGFFVAERQGSIVGTAMVGYDGHRGAVNYLAVSPNCQRQGIGRMLMSEVERWLVERGCPKINILIRSTNSRVGAFYQALGYKSEDVVCVGKRLIADD